MRKKAAVKIAAIEFVTPMSPEQAAKLRQLAQDGYEPEAFKPNLTCAEAERRIVMLTAKRALLDEPPHTL